jgi:hypothetical protein
MRHLRALRYNHNPQLAEFIKSKLFYLDFDGAIDFYATIGNNRDDMALLGCNDRFYLLAKLLNRVDIVHPWLYDRCREVELHPDGMLDLWARFHYKSTIITFGGIIQEVLIDPNLCVAIFSHTQPIAKAFLEQIKREFEENKKLQLVYDDVLWTNPRQEAAKWSSEEGIILKRTANPREATVEAHGLVDNQPISRHYNLLVYDDVVTEKSVTSPEMITKTTRMWELSDNLSTHKGSRKWHAGTRYHHGDTYGIILDRKALKERRYAATDDGTLKGTPIFLTPARWAEIKTSQRSTVSAQMLLNPVAGNEAIFLSEWFTGYEVFPAMMNIYILCDPSKGRRTSSRSTGSDRTAIAVIGIDPGGNKYLLDGYCHRMRLSQRYAFIKALYEKWCAFPGVQVVKVGYEQYGQQVDLEVLEEYMQRDKTYFEVEELNFPREGMNSKKHRVERLEPDMKSGRFLMPAVVFHPEVVPVDHNVIAPQTRFQVGVNRGDCLWTVWTQQDQDKAQSEGQPLKHTVGQIIYRPLRAITSRQRFCEKTQQHYRIVRPLRRIDEDGNVYDLTRVMMEEARFFPFAPHDDLIDAASRIFDMEPAMPVAHESLATEASPEDDFGHQVGAL